VAPLTHPRLKQPACTKRSNSESELKLFSKNTIRFCTRLKVQTDSIYSNSSSIKKQQSSTIKKPRNSGGNNTHNSEQMSDTLNQETLAQDPSNVRTSKRATYAPAKEQRLHQQKSNVQTLKPIRH
jgi:hypothetical protein